MAKYLLLFAISFCVSLALTPLARALALRLGAVDLPSERKIHSEPIPRLGGVGVFLALVAGLLVADSLGGTGEWFIPLDVGALMPILSGSVIVFVAGVWDDIRPLSAGVKFLFQAAAAIVAIGLGVRIEEVFFFGTGTWELGVLAIPMTFLWVVGITNAFNLVDGLDGLATGLASIAAGTCAAIFLLRGDAHDAMLLVILLGALLGFLRYNFNPARIFLGDSGSLVVGYVLAVTAIIGSQKGATALAVVVPLLVFGLPILDTLLSMVRRFVAGLRVVQPYKASFKERVLAAKRMFEADQGHIHHRLLAIGVSHRNAVLTMYAVALGLSGMALLSVLAQFRNAGIILVAVGLATYVGVRKLGYEEVTFLRRGTLLRWYEQLAFNRLFFAGFVDLIVISGAYWLSFVLKYEFQWSPDLKTWYVNAFPVVLVLQFGLFGAFGLYRGVWRATGIGDLVRIVLVVSAATGFSYALVQVSEVPASVLPFFCIDLLVLGALVVGTRSLYRVLDYSSKVEGSNGSGALIYGAGRGGQLVLRELQQNPALGLRPLGFLDDDPALRKRTINRVPIMGASADLASILDRQLVASMVISSDKIHHDRLEAVLSICHARNIPVVHAHLKWEPIWPDGNGGNGGEASALLPANQGDAKRET
ncbi:MAG: undecaprenyl-phosphate alpha-N-acetylglucosaminyl 1-phosphate transferase [Nitrospira sp.]|nr:MAG: undecaprenyl-phosphate alpha-N-acetylglucosaminyl 1-phosphate transferase [Nitrospira sp.]